MTIDWNAVATIAAPVIALFAGVWVNRKFENRPTLITYFGHISSFHATAQNGQPVTVHTHTVIVRNAGHRSATNVRIHHSFLPDFNIWPSVAHHIDNLPDGTRDIVIPTLVPKEQITISYLYQPPMTAAEVNAGIKSDQGFAQHIPVLLQRQYPRWANLLALCFCIIGIISVLYLIYHGVEAFLR